MHATAMPLACHYLLYLAEVARVVGVWMAADAADVHAEQLAFPGGERRIAVVEMIAGQRPPHGLQNRS